MVRLKIRMEALNMDNSYWNVFKETGNPISFLLCKAAEKNKKPQKSGGDKQEAEKTPKASS